MILYLDTSSLVKLYVIEQHSDQVTSWAEAAEVVATSCVTLPEAMSALVRRRSEGTLRSEDFENARADLEMDWAAYPQVIVDEQAAAALVLRHGLRGFDAIHLAAALSLRTEETTVAFSSFDVRQQSAARAEGLNVLDPPLGGTLLER